MKRVVTLAAVSLAAIACGSERGFGVDIGFEDENSVRPPENNRAGGRDRSGHHPEGRFSLRDDNSCSMATSKPICRRTSRSSSTTSWTPALTTTWV